MLSFQSLELCFKSFIMKIYLTFLLALLLSSICNAQYVGLNISEINQLRELIKTDSIVAKQFDIHNKKAIAALNDIPNPRDTIVSQGHLRSDPNKTASILSMQDYNKIYALSLLYKVKGTKEYFDKAVVFLKAWATVNHPTGHPINDTKLDRLLEAYDMLRPEINKTDKQLIDSWLILIAENELLRHQKGKSSTFSNWHSHRLKVVGEIGYILDNKPYINYAVNGLLLQIDTNLNNDGTSFDFLERDALHYHAYDLEPMLCLAIIIKRATGIDYFNYTSPKGASIKNSVDWFVPYLTKEKTHAEYVNTKIKFDVDRANNKEKGFTIGKNFEPQQGLYTLSLAAWFDYNYMRIIEKIKKSETDISDWQIVLNKVIK